MSSPAATEPEKFDGVADEYDALHAESIKASGESTEYFARHKLDWLMRLGRPTDGAVLDYGCGIGNLTEQLVTQFTRVHGFDPSLKSVEIARKRAPAATFYDSAERIPSDTFDTVILSGVLHHVPPNERRALMEGVRDKLSVGGKVVIFEHNPINPLTRRAVATCAFDDDAILLWPWEAKKLLRDSGLAEVDLKYVVFFPHALAALRPWNQAWLGCASARR